MLLSLFERWGVDSSNPYLHTAGGAQVSAGETYIICHHHFFYSLLKQPGEQVCLCDTFELL